MDEWTAIGGMIGALGAGVGATVAVMLKMARGNGNGNENGAPKPDTLLLELLRNILGESRKTNEQLTALRFSFESEKDRSADLRLKVEALHKRFDIVKQQVADD
jgi:hypothetical protein